MKLKSLLTVLGMCTLTACTPKLVKDPLFVNLSHEHYQKEKSRKEGEKDLQKLTQHSNLEEAWFFAEYPDKAVWQEAGYAEWPMGVMVDEKVALPLVNLNLKNLSFYHHHPVFQGDKYDSSQVPSKKDFIVCKELMEDLDEFCLGYSDKMDCRVVVSSGVYTIKIDSLVVQRQLENFLFEDFLTEMENEVQEEMFSAFNKQPSKYNYYKDNQVNFPKINKQFAKEYSNDLVKITFEELE